ncbi:G5 domain-containing protein [Paractinoplanes lichenicola]|uniref:G5 domain-containing protein n=1 Tax=Paractinoplanes lichenicola TaxID=2802976 RepID=A0ABS1VJP8_9ACTN|nr:G5 domain-containing protein [Actinoplanes lichenicola]MBL7254884.1 G5 domain-containing protein [Actinoplanes lichenicola]
MPRKSWWARLPFGVRMTVGASALLIVIGGGVAGIAALTGDDPDAPRIVTAVGDAAGTGTGAAAPEPGSGIGIATAEPGSVPMPPPAAFAAEPPHLPAGHAAGQAAGQAAGLPRISDKADRTATRAPKQEPGTPRQAPAKPIAPPAAQKPPAVTNSGAGSGSYSGTAAAPSQPQVTTRTDTETRDVPFQTRYVRDPFLPRGVQKVQAAGVTGEETLRYLVTLTDGRETDRKLMDITVTRQPQHRVIAFGARRGFDRAHGDRCDERRLGLCVPLGRKACPEPRPEESGASISVLDQDIALLGGQTVDELPQIDCGTR